MPRKTPEQILAEQQRIQYQQYYQNQQHYQQTAYMQQARGAQSLQTGVVKSYVAEKGYGFIT
eukprot:SAG11_NODE_16631_length_542_cov_0.697517_1_plen_61_part_10